MAISARSDSIGPRLLPILGWLPSYRRAWLLLDILAGVAVWAVMVPEGMAYSGIVGVPAGRHRACDARFCSWRPVACRYARLTKPTTVPPLHMPRKYTATK